MNHFKIMNRQISKNGVSLKFPKPYSEIEKEIRSIRYVAAQFPRGNRVEANNQFPPFILSFYDFIFNAIQKKKSNIIPTAEELATYYLSENTELKKTYNGFVLFNNEYYDSRFIKGRLFRSYPSIVRDFQFTLLMNELLQQKQADCFTCYDSDKDLNGIDVTICYTGKNFNIGLCVNTDKAKRMIAEKEKRLRAKSLTVPDSYYALTIIDTGNQSIQCWTKENCEKVISTIFTGECKNGKVHEI